jgi:hypothetical protein
MSLRNDPEQTNPAAWGCLGHKKTAGYEWIDGVGKIVLILAILIPLVIVASTRPRSLAHISTYAIVIGGLGSVLFMIALGVRSTTYRSMTLDKRVVFVMSWCVYCLMVVVSVVLVAIKY